VLAHGHADPSATAACTRAFGPGARSESGAAAQGVADLSRPRLRAAPACATVWVSPCYRIFAGQREVSAADTPMSRPPSRRAPPTDFLADHELSNKRAGITSVHIRTDAATSRSAPARHRKPPAWTPCGVRRIVKRVRVASIPGHDGVHLIAVYDAPEPDRARADQTASRPAAVIGRSTPIPWDETGLTSLPEPADTRIPQAVRPALRASLRP